jgi:RNA polymerase sigma-70 factor (ECF subfamily)
VPEQQPQPAGWFPTTQWSAVLAAAQDRTPQSAEALEKLCRAYWYPLYAFVRRQGHEAAEAQDLTQEFFSRLLSKNTLQMATPDRGRFRSFLLGSMKHMLANEHRNATRLKRGGGAFVFSLDAQEAEDRFRLEPVDHASPDRLFDRRWAEAILARVLDRLEAEYSGHALRFDELKVFLIEAKGASSFAEVAARLGVTESALKSVIHRMRRRYGQLFRDEIVQTVADPASVEDEIRHLLTALAE